jgi:hypothetical protein
MIKNPSFKFKNDCFSTSIVHCEVHIGKLGLIFINGIVQTDSNSNTIQLLPL